MKKGLFLSLFLTFVCFPVMVLAQETKPKLPVSADVDRVVIEMHVIGNKVYTENVPVGKKIEVLSVVGLKVTEIEIKNSTGEYPLNVPKGYYILKISDTDIIRKVAVR